MPAVISVIHASDVTGENRSLAPIPKMPQSGGDILKFTKQLEPWMNDHFGFRASLILINNKIRHTLFNKFPTIQVIAGRNNRIFLSSHATYLAEYSAITIPCGATLTPPEKVAGQLNKLYESFRREDIDAKIMIVPSAPVIYPEELPVWLESRCKSAISPIELALGSSTMKTATREAIYFPKTEMIALKNGISVFPKTWFHWAGAGPRQVAGLSVDFFWGISENAGHALAEISKQSPSDISHLFPGVNLSSEIEYADFSQSKIAACIGVQCFPSINSIAEKLKEVAIYRNPEALQHRLIILSDSFGQFIAGWYSRYFKEVIHFSTNTLNQLDKAEIEQLKTYIKAEAKTAQLLLLYHDGSVLWDRPAQDEEFLFPKAKITLE
jgi:hypothetical protein